jgi:lysylphosphatidylglycerol synthetase-like protein (DUF2156 family)
MTDAANELPAPGAHSRPETHDRLGDVDFPDRPEGPIAAAILAGGIGAVALGFFTTMAEVSEDLKSWLDFRSEVGPLAGKTIMAVVVWLLAWVVLHLVYRGKPYETRRAFVIAMVLVAIGVVGTFPTFFEAFASE